MRGAGENQRRAWVVIEGGAVAEVRLRNSEPGRCRVWATGVAGFFFFENARDLLIKTLLTNQLNN